MPKLLQVPRPEKPLSRQGFIDSITDIDRFDRKKVITAALLAGNVPEHMRKLNDFEFTFRDKEGEAHELKLYVMSDYLSVGDDESWLRIPMDPLMAWEIADAWGCVLPTTKMVTLIWEGAVQKVTPQPWGPPYDHTMMSTERYVAHDDRVSKTVQAAGYDPTRLLAGHKKDVVLTNVLMQKPKQVAIYGWHRANGKPIQGLYLGHVNHYADYSHGIRLVSHECVLDGNVIDIQQLWADDNLAVALSSEGSLTVFRQPA